MRRLMRNPTVRVAFWLVYVPIAIIAFLTYMMGFESQSVAELVADMNADRVRTLELAADGQGNGSVLLATPTAGKQYVVFIEGHDDFMVMRTLLEAGADADTVGDLWPFAADPDHSEFSVRWRFNLTMAAAIFSVWNFGVGIFFLGHRIR